MNSVESDDDERDGYDWESGMRRVGKERLGCC